MVEEFFFDGVAVEPGDGAQAAGDGGPGAAAGFEIAGEELDVRAAGLEQAELVLLARDESGGWVVVAIGHLRGSG